MICYKMEELNEENKLRLPSKRFGNLPRFRPPSPKDNTPIIVNGNNLERSDLTPIIDHNQIQERDINDEKINLLDNPESIHSLLENNPKQIESSEDEQDDDEDERDRTQIEEEEEEEQEQQFLIVENPKPKPYVKFNPPFPDTNKNNTSNSFYGNNSSNSNNSNSNNNTTINEREIRSPLLSNRLAYVENVESTEESADTNIKSPKISSPTDSSPLNKTKLIQTQIKPNNVNVSSNNIVQKLNIPKQSQTQTFSQALTQPTQGLIRNPTPPPLNTSNVSNFKQHGGQQQGGQQGQQGQQGTQQGQQGTQNIPSNDPPKLSNEELIGRAHDCFLKYQILQKSWPEYKFPNLDDKLVYSNPQLIIDTYNKSVERIQIDMDVNQYKIALIIMFLVIEVVCVKFLGLDAGGYTLSQIKAMNRYEKLLIEIGEKRLLTGDSNWPPEVRILFIGLFNCGLFILMKYLSSVLGPDLVGYISPIVNGLFSGVLDNSKTANLPDEMPQRQQDITGMLGSVASMAASALSGNGNNNNQNQSQNTQARASRRPIYRE
jgi:hypothetical protein